MIVIHVNPARLEKVELVSGSEMEHDFSLAAWLVIAPFVKMMDMELQRIVGMVFGRQGRTLLARAYRQPEERAPSGPPNAPAN